MRRLKERIILALLLVLILGAAIVVWQRRPVPVSMRLDLRGTPGLKVAGTVIVDGVAREFSGVLPTSITAEARTFDYSIRMQEPRGELRGELTVLDGVYGSSSAANDFSGVKGGYSRTWRGKGGWFTTARKGE